MPSTLEGRHTKKNTKDDFQKFIAIQPAVQGVQTVVASHSCQLLCKVPFSRETSHKIFPPQKQVQVQISLPLKSEPETKAHLCLMGQGAGLFTMANRLSTSLHEGMSVNLMRTRTTAFPRLLIRLSLVASEKMSSYVGAGDIISQVS